MQYQDYYKTLGVAENATEADIKKAFRKLAKQYHPDTNTGDKKAAEEKFKQVNEAYEVLGNAQRRKEYDDLRKNIGNGDRMNFDPSKYGYAPGGAQGFGGFGNFSGGSTVFTSGGGSGFSDFFDMLFGGARGAPRGDIFGNQARYSADMRGQDIEAAIDLTAEEAFHGLKKRVSLNTGGRNKTIEFTVPAGTGEGERIRLAGQGEPGAGKGPSGDLMMAVRIAGGKYELKGLDLTADIRLTPWEAALGTKAPYATIDGEIVVKVPPGVQTDSRIRIAGKGFRDRQGNRGDLYLKVKIVNPPVLSPEEKQLYEKLSKVSKFTAQNQ